MDNYVKIISKQTVLFFDSPNILYSYFLKACLKIKLFRFIHVKSLINGFSVRLFFAHSRTEKSTNTSLIYRSILHPIVSTLSVPTNTKPKGKKYSFACHTQERKASLRIPSHGFFSVQTTHTQNRSWPTEKLSNPIKRAPSKSVSTSSRTIRYWRSFKLDGNFLQEFLRCPASVPSLTWPAFLGFRALMSAARGPTFCRAFLGSRFPDWWRQKIPGFRRQKIRRVCTYRL